MSSSFKWLFSSGLSTKTLYNNNNNNNNNNNL
jgi:hypothetical protein